MTKLDSQDLPILFHCEQSAGSESASQNIWTLLDISRRKASTSTNLSFLNYKATLCECISLVVHSLHHETLSLACIYSRNLGTISLSLKPDCYLVTFILSAEPSVRRNNGDLDGSFRLSSDKQLFHSILVHLVSTPDYCSTEQSSEEVPNTILATHTY